MTKVSISSLGTPHEDLTWKTLFCVAALLSWRRSRTASWEIVKGELGEDGLGDPVGDLVLREVPGLPACHQPKLRASEDAA